MIPISLVMNPPLDARLQFTVWALSWPSTAEYRMVKLKKSLCGQGPPVAEEEEPGSEASEWERRARGEYLAQMAEEEERV